MDDATTPILEAAPEPLRQQTYRVFKRDQNVPGSAWTDWGDLFGEGKYGYEPSPQELGEAFGTGEYLLVEKDKNYYNARFVTVIEETVYRVADDEGA